MITKILKQIFATALAAVVTMAISSFAAFGQGAKPSQYSLTDLGTLPGGFFSQALTVNNAGVASGVSTGADGAQHAVLWFNGSPTDISTPGLGGSNSFAFSANGRGQVSGQAETSTADPNNENFCGYFTGLECQPFVWQNGVMTVLPLLGGNNGTVANINSRGQITGIAENSTADPECPTQPAVNFTGPQVLDFEAVIWDSNGKVRQLSPLPGDSVATGLWINDRGQAVGGSGRCGNTLIPPFEVAPHAVMWDVDGSVHDLGNLGGTGNPNLLAIGNAAFVINNHGQVVGVSALAGNTKTHAFLWTNPTGMQDLGTLPGDDNSAALGINNRGDVVGASILGADPLSGSPRAFIWTNGVMTDLNSLAPANSSLILLTAFSINDAGQIAGFGFDLNTFEVHAFLATPINGVTGSVNLSPDSSGVSNGGKQVSLPENVRKMIMQGLLFGRSNVSISRP